MTLSRAIVKLVHHTPLPELQVIAAFRKCRASEANSDSTTNRDSDGMNVNVGPKDEKLLKLGIDKGHHTPLEYVHFIFDITLSRLAHTQLVRHRISTFCAESGRALPVSEFFIPTTIQTNPEAAAIYDRGLRQAMDIYEELVKLGIPIEDARYELPASMMSTVRYQANMRSLRNAIAERICRFAHKEIRDIFFEIKDIVKSICPTLLYKVEKFYHCDEQCGECLQYES